MNKYYIKTFGCQMNYSDSERIAAQLKKGGFLPVSSLEKANLVVVNSCGVRQTAEDRVYGFIHNIWKNKPKTKIILTGCLADRKDVQRRLKNKVNLFANIKDFQKEIKNSKLIQNSKFEIRNFSNKNTASDYLFTKPNYTSKYTAYIPVMTGCNNFCAYCVVPYARGREISRQAGEIIQEVKSLIKKGYKEIILLGQNVNSYACRGRTATINFSDLLRKINAIPGHFWINFISNHPKDFSAELIKTATQLPGVCEFIHLPLQAGDNQILRKMNRKYTRQKYLKLVSQIKKSFQKYKPNTLYSLTSDIIVGFPSETRKQFLQSAEMMKKSEFDMVYFGQYSPRPGTAAYKLKDNVSKAEKSRREKYLNEILNKTSYKNNQKYLGQTLEVLIDKKEISKPSEAKLRGVPRSLASDK
ncbi:tRNA (N6-isopentenyl adenosine(37)-C2)-methylthiotransferase MiaB, partial [Patescibacteria group bacterium]|nr:tRNA (N6-isopentenyl adenosine(37)-C2)-methylthiotransferase MiaB [Patescibacteria group bacterium]